MPTNLPREWYLIDEDYRNAKNLDDKIELLKKLISATPRHKGTEHLLAELKKRLSKLRDDLEVKSRKSSANKQDTIKKSGDILVSIVGFTKSGKSTLLKSLTRASVEVDSSPYTTKKPVTGVCFFEGLNVQFVEIPSFFSKRDMSIVHVSDIILVLASNQEEMKRLQEILEANKLEGKPRIFSTNLIYDSFQDKNSSELLAKIIKESKVVRVFTKPVGKSAEKKAIVLKSGSLVRNLIRKINTNWLRGFKFARVFDDTKFSGRQVGVEYVLKDKDIVEIHTI